MQASEFEQIMSQWGKWHCVGKKKTGKGNYIRCNGTTPHSCRFVFEPPIVYTIHRLLPRYSTTEQQRMRNYSNQSGEGYFKKYLVPRGKGPK